MTDYEDNNGLVSDEMIEQFVKDEELSFTDNLTDAIYLLRNGELIDGTDEYGERTEDHKTVQTLISEGKDMYTSSNGFSIFWDALHKKTGMVRLVPESSTALISKSQTLTPEQEEVLSESDYTVEKY